MNARSEARIQAAIEQAQRLPEIGPLSELRGDLVRTLQGVAQLAASPAAEHSQLAAKTLTQAQALFVAKSLGFILGQDELPRGLGRSLRRFARKLQSAIDALNSIQISKGILA